MDMSNIADLVVAHVDVQPMNIAIQQRAEALAGQMNAEAAEQFINDMKSLECSVSSDGNTLSFKVNPTESYLIEYLKKHGTPVSGGDGGIAHNVDGSTYQSRVPEQFQGTELPSLELPTLNGEDEANHLVEIMAPDAANNAINESKSDIAEDIVKPYISQEIYQMLGGN